MSSIEALLANAPTAAPSGSDGPRFIGLPKDTPPWTREVRAEGQGWISQPAARQPYAEGEEMDPGRYSPEKIASFQDELIAVGLIPKRATYRRGFWDDTSAKAYYDLLAIANRQQMDAAQTMQMLRQHPEIGADGTAGGDRPKLAPRVTNAADIRAYIKKGATETIGRSVSDSEVEELVKAFQATQVADQTAAYNADETGATTAEGPSLDTFVENQLRQSHPLEAQGNDLANTFGRFESILNGMSEGV